MWYAGMHTYKRQLDGSNDVQDTHLLLPTYSQLLSVLSFFFIDSS